MSVIAFCASVTISLICAGIMGYYLWKYILCRASIAIHIRHPDLPIISISILLAFVLIQRPLASAIWTLRVAKSPGIIALSDCLFSTCYFGNFFAIFWRVYWLNFDMHTYREGMGISWRHLIDPTEENKSQQRDEDRKTKGNFRWCLMRYCGVVAACVLMFTVLGLPALSMEGSEKTDAYITEMSFLLLVSTVVAIYTVVVWNDLPHDDLKYLYFVKAELRYLLWAMLVGWLLCIIGIPAGSTPKTLQWRIYFDVVPTLVAFCLAMIQTWYVMDRCKIDMKRARNRRLQKSEKVDMDFKTEKEKFVVAMQNDHIFDLYVAHLQKEFSLENLLCAMEYRQLATLVLSAPVWLNDDSREGNISRSKFLARHDHDFYQRAPPSAILKEGYSFEMKVSQLYQKYISTSAQMQVNLPAQLRQRWELFHVSFCTEVGVDASKDVTTAVSKLAGHLQNDLQEVISPGGPDDYLAGGEGGHNNGMTPRHPRLDDRPPMDEHQYLVMEYDDGDGHGPKYKESMDFDFGKSRVAGMGISEEFERQYYLQVLTLIDMTMREAYKLMCDSYTRFSTNTVASDRLNNQIKEAKLR